VIMVTDEKLKVGDEDLALAIRQSMEDLNLLMLEGYKRNFEISFYIGDNGFGELYIDGEVWVRGGSPDLLNVR